MDFSTVRVLLGAVLRFEVLATNLMVGTFGLIEEELLLACWSDAIDLVTSIVEAREGGAC